MDTKQPNLLKLIHIYMSPIFCVTLMKINSTSVKRIFTMTPCVVEHLNMLSMSQITTREYCLVILKCMLQNYYAIFTNYFLVTDNCVWYISQSFQIQDCTLFFITIISSSKNKDNDLHFVILNVLIFLFFWQTIQSITIQSGKS